MGDYNLYKLQSVTEYMTFLNMPKWHYWATTWCTGDRGQQFPAGDVNLHCTTLKRRQTDFIRELVVRNLVFQVSVFSPAARMKLHGIQRLLITHD